MDLHYGYPLKLRQESETDYGDIRDQPLAGIKGCRRRDVVGLHAPHSKGGGKSENVLSVDENHYVSGGDDEHCMMPLHVIPSP